MSIRKHVAQPWFDLIKSGKKTYEGRICDGIWAELKAGSVLSFFNDAKEEVEVEVINVPRFPTFKEAIQNVGLEKVLPTETDKSIDDAVRDVYYKYFTKEMEARYGVVMLRIKIK